MTISNKPEFQELPSFEIKFNIAYKTKQTKGFLNYEYNPIRNLRINEDRYKIEESTGIYLDFEGRRILLPDKTYLTRFNINRYKLATEGSDDNKIYEKIKPVDPGIPFENGRLYIEHYANELIDFRTDKLNLDLNHPIDIEAQSSYDGSINLILNDDLNTPKLVNTRFSPIGEGQYEIVDRSGNNDTNIYDEFNLVGETNLYKSIDRIPYINFKGVSFGGQLKVGNYVFYFKYVDSDGNETDFVGESGIVSIFKGSYPKATRGYLGDYISDNLVTFILDNIDSSYDYVNVYYTRSTGNYNKTELLTAHKINSKYTIVNGISKIVITGFEDTIDVSLDEINISYNVISKAKTQAQAQSRLFLGNVDKTTVPYTELADLSLHLLPKVCIEDKNSIGYVNEQYYDISSSTNKNEYYNPDNIYYRLGYWEDIYRLGVVYILNDFTLSPVFNIRGGDLGDNSKDFSKQLIYSEATSDNLEKVREYIEVNSEGFITTSKFSKNTDFKPLENSKGIIRIQNVDKENIFKKDGIIPIGIKIEFDNDSNKGEDLLTELRKYAKGFFIVRQKRIPTIYCQGITIGLDSNSNLPVIPNDISNNQLRYFTESFMDSDKTLVHNFETRMVTTNAATTNAAIIPEAELNSELYSQLFSASEYVVTSSSITSEYNYFFQSDNPRHFYIPEYKFNDNKVSRLGTILTFVNDGIQLISSGTTEFSSKAGTAEEAYKYSQFEKEDITADATNLLRGNWGPYVGIEGYEIPTSIFNVMISGYKESLLKEYFISRMESNEPYFPICDRLNFDSLIFNNGYSITCFRGDCFIGNFTHRMCRNFQDPEAPNNDKIIDPNTWKDHYKGYANGALDLEEASKINRGDVNAVKIGHWVTFKCMSNINFATRVEDDSNGSEVALIGHPRTFAPVNWLQADGEYKVPDSTVINVGYNSTTSDKYNFILPDVPYIKNEFSNRIMYSDIHITDAFKNAYRTFQLNNYRDYSKEYGSITELMEWYGNLLVVFEHGVGLIPVNEKVQVNNSEGDNEIYINSNKVLPERPIMLSKTFGSQWKDSVVKSERFIYGVDTVGKRIWRTDGKGFETISDFKIQSFLNDNLKLSEREITPLLGVRNVKSHYNGFKYDIMFTFYNDIKSKDNLGNDITSIEWNMCFNEKLNLWTTRYSWIPLLSENIDNIYFTYDKESAKNVSAVSSCWRDSYTSRGIVLSNCYTSDDPSSPFAKDYLEEVIYPGVEFPILTNTTKEIAIGKLELKLDSIDNTKVESLDYSFEDGDNDNEDFYIKSLPSIEDPEKFDYYLMFKLTKDTEATKNSPFIPGTYTKYKDKYYAKLDLQVRINREGVKDEELLGQIFKDTLTIRLSYLNNVDQAPHESTYFWKHGVAGIIDNQGIIENCKWFDRHYPFEFEFIVNKEGARHKIFDNFQILSNNVPPKKILYEVIGDAYWFSKYKEISYKYQQAGDDENEKYLIEQGLGNTKEEDEDGEYYIQDYIISFDKKLYYDDKGKLKIDINGEPIYLDEYNAEFFKDRKLNQYMMRKSMDVRDIKVYGNIIGNSVYKEDLFKLEIDPLLAHKLSFENGNDVTPEDLESIEIRPRDKFMRVRVVYERNKNQEDSNKPLDKPIVTAIQTIYTQSFS